MLQNKKYPFFFHGGRFLPTTPYQVEISFKFHTTYFLFVLAMKTPLLTTFKDPIIKQCKYSLCRAVSHVIELSILLHRDIVTGNAILFICEN